MYWHAYGGITETLNIFRYWEAIKDGAGYRIVNQDQSEVVRQAFNPFLTLYASNLDEDFLDSFYNIKVWGEVDGMAFNAASINGVSYGDEIGLAQMAILLNDDDFIDFLNLTIEDEDESVGTADENINSGYFEEFIGEYFGSYFN